MLEPGKPLSAYVAAWEASEGADLMLDLLRDPALVDPDAAAFARSLATRAADLIRADYVCICSADPDLDVIAEHGPRNMRLLNYVGGHAAASPGTPKAVSEAASVHTVTMLDQELNRYHSFSLSALPPACRGRLIIAASRVASDSERGIGFDPIELELLRWFAASTASLLAHVDRTWGTRNALLAESGTAVFAAYAITAHQLLLVNVNKKVSAHVDELRSTLMQAVTSPATEEQVEYLRRVQEATDNLERCANQVHLEAEYDAQLPNDRTAPLPLEQFLEACVAKASVFLRHVHASVLPVGCPSGDLPVLRVDLDHLEHVMQALIGHVASCTLAGSTLTLEAGTTSYEVWFSVSHDGSTMEPEGLAKEASMVRALAHAVGGTITAEPKIEGGTRFTLCMPREDCAPPELEVAELEVLG